MFLNRWLRHPKFTCPSIHDRRPRFRLGVEGLEDRSVPAVLNVTTTLDVIDPNDGLLSLREAVIQANASNGADTISLSAGTYTLSIAGAGEDASLTGDLDLTGHVRISGAGRNATVIDAAGLDRVFDVLFDSDATISDMTVRGGKMLGDSVETYTGGGIRNGGTLTLSGCSVTNNVAGIWGGGIFNAGKMSIIDCSVSSNSANDSGGGIYNAGIMTIRDSQVAENSTGNVGGGILNYVDADLTVNNCSLLGNSAIRGGALYTELGVGATAVVLIDSTFAGNSAREGGGIFFEFGTAARIANCTFANNFAHVGGGLVNEASDTSVVGCTFTGNSASEPGNPPGGLGGAILNTGHLSVRDSILSGNSATRGGAIVNGGTLTISDSTLVGNTAGLGGDVYNAGVLYVFDSTIGDRFDA